MERLTTDTPKDNLEMALNLFYIKDHETWVRGYGPAPEYADVSLFDLTRDIVKTHIPDAELPADDDAFSNMMPEWLMDGIDSAEGIIALLYTAAWAYAELRNKLMRYEESGMEPEEIKEHEAAYIEIMTRTYGPLHQKIGQWLQAEQEGRLVVLPCKTKETVYVVGIQGVRARDRFSGVWDSTIKPADLPLYGWGANPWVWVIEFERVSKEAALKGGEG